eukprot:6577270-Pyramimonas_sp.AAC.3
MHTFPEVRADLLDRPWAPLAAPRAPPLARSARLGEREPPRRPPPCLVHVEAWKNVSVYLLGFLDSSEGPPLLYQRTSCAHTPPTHRGHFPRARSRMGALPAWSPYPPSPRLPARGW